MVTLICIFMTVGFIVPFVYEATDTPSTNTQLDQFGNEIGQLDQNDVSFLTIAGSIFSMFFWTFGALPVWLDTFFLILRVVFALTIYNAIRGNS